MNEEIDRQEYNNTRQEYVNQETSYHQKLWIGKNSLR